MPVLPKHAIDVATFEDTTLSKPIGSGPYVVADVDCRKERDVQARPQLLGPRACDQSRLVEFRRDPLRLLPRRQCLFRSLQGRALRRAQRERSEPLADRLRHSRPCATAASSRSRSRRPAETELRLMSSTRGGRSLPTSACARRSRCCSISSGSTAISSSASIERSAGFFDGSELSAYHRPADERERALLAPFPTRCAPTCSTAPGRLRRRTAPAATARRCGEALESARRRRLRTPGHDAARARRAAGRSPSRSW